jgi:hypothetical protein
MLPLQNIRGLGATDMPLSKNVSSGAMLNAVSKPIDIPSKPAQATHAVPIADVLMQPMLAIPEELTIIGRAVTSVKGYLSSF